MKDKAGRLSSLKRFGGYVVKHTFLPLLMIVASFLLTVLFAILGLFPWSWSSAYSTLILFAVWVGYSAYIMSKHQKEETQEHFRKLKRLTSDFCELVFIAQPQDRDIRMMTVIETASSAIRSEGWASDICKDTEIRLSRELIRIADDLIEAWFDEFGERLELLTRNPKILDRDGLGELVFTLKRVIFQHYDTVIERSASLISKFYQKSERPEQKFEEFKTRYNGFVGRMDLFLKELADLGYKTERGFDLRYITKKLW